MRRVVFLLFVALTIIAAPAWAQTPQAGPGNGLQWDQGAGSLAQANGYLYRATEAGASRALIVTCTGTTAPFVCGTDMDVNQAPGLHTVSVTASVMLVDGTILESLPSDTFTYEWVAPPPPPAGLRLRPRPSGLTLPPPGN